MSETEFARAEKYWQECCRLTNEVNALRAENEKLKADYREVYRCEKCESCKESGCIECCYCSKQFGSDV
jgi:hypothetical protein